MKGLVLSGGKGSRLRPFTYTGAKQLVPVANKPVLFYAIEHLVAAGVRDLGVIVGDTGEQVRAAVGDGSRFGVRVTYIEQPAPLGIAHAVLVAEQFLDGEPFVLFLGDNFLREGVREYVQGFLDSGANAQVQLCPVPNPSAFGVADVRDGRLLRVVEKPADPPSDLAVIGIYLFDAHVLEAVKSVRPSARGELEITDTIQWLIDHGLRVDHRVVRGPWIDTGRMDDILQANRLLLEDLQQRNEGTVDGGSRLVGTVVLERGARVERSVIHGPAIIGEETVVRDAYIGPFTSVYHHCRIERAELAASVVLEHTELVGLPHRIEDSLIGRFVRVEGEQSRPRVYRLVLGDHSRVAVP